MEERIGMGVSLVVIVVEIGVTVLERLLVSSWTMVLSSFPEVVDAVARSGLLLSMLLLLTGAGVMNEFPPSVLLLLFGVDLESGFFIEK
jgi:ABC-type multidrug transport system permease subunit